MNEFKRIYDTTETTEAGAAEPAESTETTETAETTETPDTESVQETGALSDDEPDGFRAGYDDRISGGDLADVSGSDLAHVQKPTQSVVSPTVRYTAADPIDYTDTLAHIDYMLTLIVFLLLFGWAAHHVKNAVRSFTGRGIK